MKNSKIRGLFMLFSAVQVVHAEPITLANLANSVQAYSGARVNNSIIDPDYSTPSHHSEASAIPISGSGYDAFYDLYYTYSASAKAYADVASGKVGVYTTSLDTGPGGNNIGSVNAFASFTDYLQLHIPGATETTATTIPFKIAIDGNFIKNGGPVLSPAGGVIVGFGITPIDYSMNYPQSYRKYIASYVTEQFVDPDSRVLLNSTLEVYEDEILNNIDLNYEPISDGNYDLIGSFEVYGADPIVGFTLGMEAYNNADFYHTAGFSFDLPQNVTFQSASGVFLTAAVPEPETYALMLAGLGLVGFCARRKKCS